MTSGSGNQFYSDTDSVTVISRPDERAVRRIRL